MRLLIFVVFYLLFLFVYSLRADFVRSLYPLLVVGCLCTPLLCYMFHIRLLLHSYNDISLYLGLIYFRCTSSFLRIIHIVPACIFHQIKDLHRTRYSFVVFRFLVYKHLFLIRLLLLGCSIDNLALI